LEYGVWGGLWEKDFGRCVGDPLNGAWGGRNVRPKESISFSRREWGDRKDLKTKTGGE